MQTYDFVRKLAFYHLFFSFFRFVDGFDKVFEFFRAAAVNTDIPTTIIGHKKTTNRSSSFSFNLKLKDFFDLSRFTGKITKIIEFSPSDFTSSYDLDVGNLRGMKGERSFNADTVRNSSDGESLSDTASWR